MECHTSFVLATRTFLFADLRDCTRGMVQATWYIGRLEAWAQGLGVDVTER